MFAVIFEGYPHNAGSLPSFRATMAVTYVGSDAAGHILKLESESLKFWE